MYDIVIYRGEIYPIGGIETWLINLARRYGKTHKMLVVYRSEFNDAVREIARYCEIKRYDKTPIRSKKAVFCYDFLGVDEAVADEYIYAVHADYRELNWLIKTPKKITKIVSVSEVARQGQLERYGVDSEVVYNPVDVSSVRPVLKLVSGTRLSEEKGLDRMVELAHALDRTGVLYEWHVFTNRPPENEISPNMIFRKPTRHLLGYVKSADYLVQLSNTESYGYSIVEALSIGTPVIVTDIPVLGELGVTDKHGIIVRRSGEDYDAVAKSVITKKHKFTYTPPADGYDKLFSKGSGSDYKDTSIDVRNISNSKLTLLEEGIDLERDGAGVVFSEKRAKYLEDRGLVKRIHKTA